jgi:hypothetical protein
LTSDEVNHFFAGFPKGQVPLVGVRGQRPRFEMKANR